MNRHSIQSQDIRHNDVSIQGHGMFYPLALRTKEILHFINEAIDFEGAKEFSDLDELEQEKFVSLALNALDEEQAFNSETTFYISKWLANPNSETAYDMQNAMAKDLRDYYEPFFNAMIAEILEDREFYE